ncbi:MAG: serine/threonine protein kinase, partial [Planctomycetaceae bacterium]|nr:serine/threonine protein kinase [Planctomycetaceae bacterium]
NNNLPANEIQPNTKPTAQPITQPVSSTDSIHPAKLTTEIFTVGAIPSGTMLGHFEIKSYIGGGGMGRVYLATDTQLDRNVAVKVLPHQRVKDQSTVARFMNEAKSAARLNHEHIAQVYFAGEQDGIPFIVFEYVEGTNIRAMISDTGAFPLPQALNFMLQITSALAHAAENGVVHRDVKPSNILITREGRAKLIDMGLARLLNPSDGAGDLTASGVTLGTFDYISPEQARDPRNADIRSDIYSLGCTFFFMLSGRPPFPEGTVLQKLLQHQGDLPPDIREFNPKIPSEVASLIQKMMAKDPRQRFQSPDILIAALSEIARQIGMQPVGHGYISWTMRQKIRPAWYLKHAIWITAAGLLLVLFAAMNLTANRYGQLELPTMPPQIKSIANSATKNNTGTNSTQPNRNNHTTNNTTDTNKTNAPNTNLFAVLDTNKFERQVRLRFPILDTVTLGAERGSERGGEFILRLFDKSRTGLQISPDYVEADILSDKRVSAVVGMADLLSREVAGGRSANKNNVNAPNIARPVWIRVDPGFDADFEPVFPELNEANSNQIRTYTNLNAAIEAAGTNAIIELRWNDTLLVKPFSLNGQNIRFVAAEGYHPTILFEPATATTETVSARTRSMMSVNSCELEFFDVAIEMRINKDVLASRWTLFDSAGTNKFDFSHVTITITNAAQNFSAYHQDVAFFRSSQVSRRIDGTSYLTDFWALGERFLIESGDTAWNLNDIDRGETDKGRLPYEKGTLPNLLANRQQEQTKEQANQLSVRLLNSMIRGEATVVQNDISAGVDFVARRSLVALAKPFIQIEGNRRTAATRPIRIAFDRVTFAGRESFAKMFTGVNQEPPTRIDCDMQSSIFLLGNMPLFELVGRTQSDKINNIFKWNGKLNDFQNITIAWAARPLNLTSEEGAGNATGDVVELYLSDWVKRFDKDAGINRLLFAEFKKPMCQLQVKDLLPKLQDTSKNRPPAGWQRTD